MSTRIHLIVTVALLCWTGIYAAARIDRIDLFDKDDNLLLFVNLLYNASGANTGRTVYSGDSTYLYSTMFENDAQGNRSAERSYNFDGDLVFNTTFASQTGTTLFHTFDQFGLSWFGSQVGYPAPVNNTYTLSQNGAPAYTMTYEHAPDGSLTKISVRGADGSLLYYALFSPNFSSAVSSERPINAKPLLTISEDGICRLSIALQKTSQVAIDLYSVSGKVSLSQVSRLDKGRHSIAFGLSSNGRRLSPGVYAGVTRVNGIQVSRDKFIIQR